MLRIYIGFQAIKFNCFPPPRPLPPHFNCFPSSTTTTTTSQLFSLLHHHHIAIVFPPPPPPPPHFYCFPPPPPPPPPHFYCFPSTTTTFLLFSFTTTATTFLLFSSTTTTATTFLLFSYHHHHHHHHHRHHISIVFLHHHRRHHISIVFPPPDSIKDYQLPFLVHFVAMSRVVNNNRGLLQLLAACPAYQRQFLLKTATPQQLHALVQVLYNILMGHIPIPEEKRILLPYKDALLNLASPNVPFKTKKRVLVQEGIGFIEDVLAPVVSSLGFLMP